MEQLTYKILFVTIVSVILIGVFKSTGEAYGNEETFYKLAIAKDLALTIDVMYSAPGDFEYVYQNEVSGYDIEIKDNIVKVFKHNSGKQDPTIGISTFAGIESDIPNLFIQNEKYVKLKKINNKLQLEGVS